MKKHSAAVRRQKILALRKEPFKRSFKKICSALRADPSPVVRHEAAFVLGESKRPEAIAPLIYAIMYDHSDLVRHEAIEMLGDLGFKDKKVEDFLKKLTRDKNPFIKDTAEIALATLNL